MRVLPFKKRMIVIIGSLLLSSLCIGLFIMRPTLRDIRHVRESIGQTRYYLEERYAQSQLLERSVRELEGVAARVEKFKNTTIARGSELALITELEALAEQHAIVQQLDVRLVEPEKKNQKEKLGAYYEFSFLNQGDFENHLAYLRSLELLPYYVHIHSLGFEKRGGETEVGPMPTSLRFTARIYVAP